MARAGLFRSAAVERLSTPDRLDQPLEVTSPTGWLALASLSLIVLAGIVAAFVVRAPITAPGSGILLPASGILDVASQAGGQLVELSVGLGDRVQRGQAIGRLDQPDLGRELSAVEAEQRDLQAERGRVVQFQTASGAEQARSDAERRNGLSRSIALGEQRLGFYRERAALLQPLVDKKLVVRQTLVDQQIEIGRAQEAIAESRHQLEQVEVDATNRRIGSQKDLLALDLRIADAARRRDAAAQKLGEAKAVVSPYAGRVVEIKHAQGELLTPGQAIVSLLPDEARAAAGAGGGRAPLELVLFSPAADGKRIRPGMLAEISPSTVRREEYGFLLGRVRRVAVVPSTAEGMMRVLKNNQLVSAMSARGAPLEVDVTLDTDPRTVSGYRWSSSSGPNAQIGPGTLAEARIQVRRLRLAEVALPALQRVFHDSP